jgi:hypothetical protein
MNQSFSCYFFLYDRRIWIQEINIRILGSGSATLEESIPVVISEGIIILPYRYRSFPCDLHRLSVSTGTDNHSNDSQWTPRYRYLLNTSKFQCLLILDICSRTCVCFGQIFVTHLFSRPLQYKHWDVFWPWHPLIGEGHRVPLGMFS